MGSGAFGWLAFGWYSLPTAGAEPEPERDLSGVGGSVRGSPLPGGSMTSVVPGGSVVARKPGGSVRLVP